MKKLILFFLISVNFLFGYFIVDDNYYRQAQVLKSLDIDMTFFQDDVFINMKEDMSKYKTKQFLNILENGSEFVPILKKMISGADIPDAFLYLAMAESSFSTKAYSKAKASGLWQFMAPTAKIYNLEINEYVDERRDPIKSTQAAIEYLQYLHERFGKWYLAAMAYNCGEGRVSRAIQEAQTDDLEILLDENKKYVPAETRRYIRKIVMMAHLSENTNFIVSNEADYLLNSGNNAVNFEKIEVKGGTSLKDIADSIDMSLEQLLSYNHHLNYFFTPPNKTSYHVYIPSGKKNLFFQNFDTTKNNSKFYIYTVNKGDTFFKIAKNYNINYKIIKDFNNLQTNNLKVGQKIIIPVLEKNINFYIVQNGDTLLSISTKYNISVQELMKKNNLKDSNIYVGGKLEIPSLY